MSHDVFPRPGLTEIGQADDAALVQFDLGIQGQEQRPNVGKAEAPADTAANGRHIAELGPDDMADRFLHGALSKSGQPVVSFELP